MLYIVIVHTMKIYTFDVIVRLYWHIKFDSRRVYHKYTLQRTHVRRNWPEVELVAGCFNYM